jgi:hypothetical protein
VEAQWTWIDAIRAGWDANGTKPKSYASGTWGPSAAIALTERDGVGRTIDHLTSRTTSCNLDQAIAPGRSACLAPSTGLGRTV